MAGGGPQHGKHKLTACFPLPSSPPLRRRGILPSLCKKKRGKKKPQCPAAIARFCLAHALFCFSYLSSPEERESMRIFFFPDFCCKGGVVARKWELNGSGCISWRKGGLRSKIKIKIKIKIERLVRHVTRKENKMFSKDVKWLHLFIYF